LGEGFSSLWNLLSTSSLLLSLMKGGLSPPPHYRLTKYRGENIAFFETKNSSFYPGIYSKMN
jgi:hypothetical protein